MSGKGRGRGWLQLTKPQEPKIGSSRVHSPTVLAGGATTNGDSSSSSSSNSNNMSMPAQSQFDSIVQTLAKFSENDDGIMINQKYRYITDCMVEECKTQDHVRECFEYIYDQVLRDETLVPKFLKMVTLNSFRELFICDVRVRTLLLNKMQTNFQDAGALFASDKVAFINAVKILAGYYEKTTMANKHYSVLVAPLTKYLEMLLDSGIPEHLELFTILMYKNGVWFMEHDAEHKTKHFVTMLIKMRSMLLTRTDLEEISRTWLLLSVDLCNNRILPLDLLKYYQKMLGRAAVHNLQIALSSSHHNVQPAPNPPVNCNNAKPQQQQQQHHNNPPKTGRPILGAGARNNKVEENNSWSADDRKENSAGADNKVKSAAFGWSDDKPPQRKSHRNKGWEHDDRFDTEY